MIGVLTPSSLEELAEAARSTPGVIATGARTKPRLSEAGDRFTPISTLRLSGIVEYQPEEYTVTALAGTPLKELATSLSTHGQYLPFDPLFLEAGCTLGGTIAAGTSGPGRFRFGGVRDFILGVRFMDGNGRLLRMGAQVVKNAAGFDVPKFFVGSLGRFGVIAEATLKVFPRPQSNLTVQFSAETPAAAVEILTQAGRSRWELQALDMPPSGGKVLARLGGPGSALESLAKEMLARWPGEILPDSEAETRWAELREGWWAYPDGVLIKSPITPAAVCSVAALVKSLPEGRVHISAGGNVAWISFPNPEAVAPLDNNLRAAGLTAVTLRGQAPLWLGACHEFAVARAVKEALDPQHRFPELV